MTIRQPVTILITTHVEDKIKDVIWSKNIMSALQRIMDVRKRYKNDYGKDWQIKAISIYPDTIERFCNANFIETNFQVDTLCKIPITKEEQSLIDDWLLMGGQEIRDYKKFGDKNG